MEARSVINVAILLFLLASPGFSQGGSDCVDKEIYEIDYRGPETHCSFTPPDHSHDRPLIHQQSNLRRPKSDVFTVGRKGGKRCKTEEKRVRSLSNFFK